MNVVIGLIPLTLIAFILLIFLQRSSQDGPNGETFVRCNFGHLFTTIWIPGVSFKAARLGLVRFQRCPIGQHWAFVIPVRPADLTAEERDFAATHRDSKIP